MPTQANQPLPDGTALQKYRILRVLAAGGFSFVYLAHDENEQPVAIKEYLPSDAGAAGQRRGAAAGRGGERRAVPRRHEMLFRGRPARSRACRIRTWCACSISSARTTPSYLVMRYERGRTLQEHITSRARRARGAVDPQYLRPAAQRPARGAYQQAAASGHQAGQRLPAQRRHAAAHRLRRRAPDAFRRGREAAADFIRRGSPRPRSTTQRELLGPWSDIYSVGATMYACLARRDAAAGERAQGRTRWCRRAAPGPASTPPSCSTSSTGACVWTTCSVRRACSRCRKPCWVNIVQASRVGGRERNEDRVGHWSAADATLLAVADGLGGHAHGEVAAQIAMDILGAAFAAQARPKLADPSQFLVQSIDAAHAAILREAQLRDYARLSAHRDRRLRSAGRPRLLDARRRLPLLPRAPGAHRCCARATTPWCSACSTRAASARRRWRRTRTATACCNASAASSSRSPTGRAAVRLAQDDILLLCSDGLWGPLTQRQLLHPLLAKPLGEAIPELVDLAERAPAPIATTFPWWP